MQRQMPSITTSVTTQAPPPAAEYAAEHRINLDEDSQTRHVDFTRTIGPEDGQNYRQQEQYMTIRSSGAGGGFPPDHSYTQATGAGGIPQPKKNDYGLIKTDADKLGDTLKNNQIASLKSGLDSKDRTQVAGTTSMFVIHVGIFKIVLDAGPELVRYYHACLGLVIAALVLQFISGVLTIYIATVKSFLSQFQRSFGYYCKDVLCPCLGHRKGVAPGDDTKQKEHTPDSSYSIKGLHRQTENSSEETGCCACCFGKMALEQEYIDTVLQEHENWTMENFQKQKDYSALPDQISWTKSKIIELQSERNHVHEKSERTIDVIDEEISDMTVQLEELHYQKQQFKTFTKAGQVVQDHMKRVTESKVMKKAAFWQAVLTVLTYIVFVLNTVITGFGLANLSTD